MTEAQTQPQTVVAFDEVKNLVGKSLGHSAWREITQEQVNTFADATGDHQWIHVDVERAKKESPFGGPIAHGYLSLSLIPVLNWQIYTVDNVKLGINYGSNKVRFINPVRVGAHVRLQTTLASVEDASGGAVQVTATNTLEIENETKPALIAETISRIVF